MRPARQHPIPFSKERDTNDLSKRDTEPTRTGGMVWQKRNRWRHPLSDLGVTFSSREVHSEQGSPGALHLDWFESLTTANKKCRYPKGYLHFLAGVNLMYITRVSNTKYPYPSFVHEAVDIIAPRQINAECRVD